MSECRRRGAAVSSSSAFFVGDAAGRPPGPKRFSGTEKKDFSDSDRKFALNVGLTFHTPEEFFLSVASEPFTLRGFDPATVLSSSSSSSSSSASYAASHQELALLVGFPGSGKSVFAHRHLVPAGYEWVNRDSLKDMGKCKSACAAALARGKSVVVDNTNPSARARAEFVKLAQTSSVKVRCFWMEASREMSEHLNRVREMAGSDHAHVPAQAYFGYASNFEEPTKSEGFEEVVRVPFVPKFENPDEERIFKWRL